MGQTMYHRAPQSWKRPMILITLTQTTPPHFPNGYKLGEVDHLVDPPQTKEPQTNENFLHVLG